MGWGSTAPGAIAGLVAALQVVDARVLDTLVITDASAKETVNVAYQSEDQPAVQDAQVDSELGTTDFDRERYTINCAVRVQTSKDVVAARERAFVLLRQVGTAIKADSRLGDTPGVMRAWISTWSLLPVAGKGGALAVILFGVDIDAYTTE